MSRSSRCAFAATHYAGFTRRSSNEHGPRSGASPIYARLDGLPPLLIQVGTHELLLDDSIRLADSAADAGVEVTLDVVPGMPHVFQSNAGVLEEADRALDRIGCFLRVNGGSSPEVLA